MMPVANQRPPTPPHLPPAMAKGWEWLMLRQEEGRLRSPDGKIRTSLCDVLGTCSHRVNYQEADFSSAG